jgi:hypothetical protein
MESDMNDQQLPEFEDAENEHDYDLDDEEAVSFTITLRFNLTRGQLDQYSRYYGSDETAAATAANVAGRLVEILHGEKLPLDESDLDARVEGFSVEQ